jgi:hypothetical protein
MEAVIDFLVPYLAHTGRASESEGVGPYEFSALRLRQVFGNASNNQLSGWLLANVLQQTGFYRVGEFPYSYFILPNGIEKILRLLNGACTSKAAKK